MNTRIITIILLLAAAFGTRAQIIGGGFNPANPPDPQEQPLKYQLTIVADPAEGGTFNISSGKYAAGSVKTLTATPKSEFVFKHWSIGDSIMSTKASISFTKGACDETVVGHFEYAPAGPGNPGSNYWNKVTGEVIVDDFTAGSLSAAVKTAIGGSNTAEVLSIIVAGHVTATDLAIADTYKNCFLLDFSRVTGVTEIPNNTFDKTNLEHVLLPASIEKIGNSAFYNCAALAVLTVHALTPPQVSSNVFTGVPDGLVVYVPAAAIPAYTADSAWGKFTILPIQDDVKSITVALPADANPADFAKLWLELTNTRNGQRMHYVMTGQDKYTFANVISNTGWNVTVRNERGDIFGRIEGVEVKDEDVSVTFTSLSRPQNAVVSVYAPDGNIVTDQCRITWLDAAGNYAAQGNTLQCLPAGYTATYSIELPQELAIKYAAPAPTSYTLTDGDNYISCRLTPVATVNVSGTVMDAATGLPLSGATVSASQTFSGKYGKTVTARTDGKGEYTFDIAAVPTALAYSAADYVSQSMACDTLTAAAGPVALPAVSLRPITGATVSLSLTYRTCEGDTLNWYSDYRNVGYEIFNVSTNRAISNFNEQYPQIVLLDDVADGDELRLTATSRTGAFMPVTITAVVGGQAAKAAFAIAELGKIRASFVNNGNASVAGTLYDSEGKLLKTYPYVNGTLTISGLPDGQYTLVTMGESELFNSIYDLSQLPRTGLAEGADYVRSTAQVTSGQISAVSIDAVPTLDESKLYYTGPGTSFTANKAGIVAGNYLTLTGRIDFKPEYAAKASNVRLIVDLPQACSFVDNSVMVGNGTSPYVVNGSQITIPLANWRERVRFCIIPTAGGSYAPGAMVQFDIDGKTITQPIGTAIFDIRDIEINVPKTISRNTFAVSGVTVANSTVKIYEGEQLLGIGKSNATGSWKVDCELSSPYNLSTHPIHAVITTPDSKSLTSERKKITYDQNAAQVSKVTMYHYNPELHKTFESVFDFLNPSTNPTQWTVYYPRKRFTYTIEFTDNDPEKVSNVVLYVHTADNKFVPVSAAFDEAKGMWIAEIDMGIRPDGYYPVNCSVDFDYISNAEIDEDLLNEDAEKLQAEIDDLQEPFDDIDETLNKLDALMNQEQVDKEDFERLILECFTKIKKVTGSLPTLDCQDFIDRLNKAKNEEERAEIINSERENRKEPQSAEYQDLNNSIKNPINETIPNQTIDGVELPAITISTTEPICDEKTGKINYPNSNYSIVSGEENTDELVLQSTSGDKVTVKTGEITNSNVSSDSDYKNWCESAAKYMYDAAELINSGIGVYLAWKEVLIDKEIARLADELAFDELLLHHELSFEPDSRFINPKYYEAEVELIKNGKTALRSAEQTKTCLRAMSKGASKVAVGFGAIDIGMDVIDGVSANNEWNALIAAIEENCSKSPETVKALRDKANYHKGWIKRRYIAKGVADLGCTALNAAGAAASGPSGGLSLTLNAVGFIGSLGTMVWEHNFSNTNDKNMKNMIDTINSIPDKCDPIPYPNKNGNKLGGGLYKSGSANSVVKIDPSGYVYEAVMSNRVEGVQATIYYKEEVEDMYGDKHENIVKWDAEEYAQKNPLFTDENGFYQWDVPQGLWQVKFEKAGYRTAYSAWLPVPPPQLDVNIAISQNVQPNVKSASAYEDAVEFEFDKYMMPATLTADNIAVTRNGTPVAGTIALLNEEASDDGKTTFASKVRFNAAAPFEAKEVSLTVNSRVKSYAGIRMQDNYGQTFAIVPEIREIRCDSVMTVGYGDSKSCAVFVLPASASAGKTLSVKSSSDAILTVDAGDIAIDKNGMAQFVVTGELPGTAALSFAVPDKGLTATSLVQVAKETVKTASAPRANIASGSTVKKGTGIELHCDTEGATIYYTLDGSCPCDLTDSRMTYDGTPIVINDDTTIKAMASHPDMYDSDVAEFRYLADRNVGIDDIAGGSGISISPVPVIDKLTVSSPGSAIVRAVVTSLNDIAVASADGPANTLTLNIGNLASGVYLVIVHTENMTYTQKIVKI